MLPQLLQATSAVEGLPFPHQKQKQQKLCKAVDKLSGVRRAGVSAACMQKLLWLQLLAMKQNKWACTGMMSGVHPCGMNGALFG